MTTKKTVRKTTSRPARRAPVKVEARVAAKPAAKPAAKVAAATGAARQRVSEALEKVRETSRKNMLAGLGLISRARKSRDERLAELVEEGKRFQPKVEKAFGELKEKLQPGFVRKIDWSRFKVQMPKLKIDTSRFDRKAIEEKLETRMADSIHRLGLPTRKEVQALARKVDRLAAAQAA
jgi:poly(hydroxyalkanoate) granule-associated protein